MADLERRGSRRPTRSQREARAYRLLVIGGAGAAVAVVGLILALITSFPPDVAVLGLIVAVVCFFLFRRSVGR
jgi:putative flippase GtrA